MSIALDIGSHRVTSLRFAREHLIGRQRRCVYAVLPNSESHRQLLAQSHVEHVPCDDGLLMLGEAAWDNAELFHVHARPLFTQGTLPEHDPIARQLMATIIEAVLPKATYQGELCALSTPGSGGLRTEAAKSDFEFFNRVVRLQGYEPILVPTPSAVALAELAPQGFTGITIVCGASCCEAALVHRGVVVCQSRQNYGGDWIDGRIAESLGLMSWDSMGERFCDISSATRLRECRPSFGQGFSAGALRRDKLGLPPIEKLAEPSEYSEVLRASLLEVLCELMSEFSNELTQSRRGQDFNQPLPMVCGGGLALTQGFLPILDAAIGSTDWHVRQQPPRIANGWPFNTARGLLIAAELETQAAMSNQRAA
mgnify:CR=1 FL=1